jgi:FtsZ-binding cell division protein ZapB
LTSGRTGGLLRALGALAALLFAAAPSRAVELGGQQVPKDRFIVFIFLGHSNMDGRARGGMDEEIHPRCWYLKPSDPKHMHHEQPLSWAPAQDSIIIYLRATSPVMPFLKGMAEACPAYHFGAIKVSHAGGLVRNFMQGGPDHEILSRHLAAARGQCVFGGVLAMFGFADANTGKFGMTGAENFAKDVPVLVSQLRQLVGVPDLPFIFGRYEVNAPNKRRYGLEHIRYWIDELPAKDPLKRTALTPKEIMPRQYFADRWHYNREGYVIWANDAIESYRKLGFDDWAGKKAEARKEEEEKKEAEKAEEELEASAEETAAWDEKLRAALGKALEEGARPEFRLARMRRKCTVKKIDRDGRLGVSARRTKMTLAWSSLGLEDRAELAVALLNGSAGGRKGEAHAVAAFYLRAAGRHDEARRHESLATAAQSTAKPAGKKERPPWPSSWEGALFSWLDSGETKVLTPKGEYARMSEAIPRDFAKYNRHFGMDLAEGSFVTAGIDDALLSSCRKTNELTVEAVVTPRERFRRGEPGAIIAFSSDSGNRNFELAQDRDRLVFRLRTSLSGRSGAGPVEIGRIRAGTPVHVVVTYRPGRLECFLDGERVRHGSSVRGGFSSWTEQNLVFGARHDRSGGWAGDLEGVLIKCRAASADEVAKDRDAAVARLEGRKPPPRLVVQARLVETSKKPGAGSRVQVTRDYPRLLLVYKYEVKGVVKGKYARSHVLVAHWAVLDLKDVPALKEKRVGGTYRLTLERFEDHPEADAEQFVQDMDSAEDLELPLFLDVGPAAR